MFSNKMQFIQQKQNQQRNDTSCSIDYEVGTLSEVMGEFQPGIPLRAKKSTVML